MRIGQKIRIIRESKGLTQIELYVRSGISPVTISGIETGRVVNPRMETIVSLARGLEVDLNQLVEDVEFEQPA